MSGHRQAAAALHGLGDQDRRLILAQLPAADQDRLRAYLTELDALGFARDAAQDVAPAAAPDLANAAPATMYALLEHEPAVLVAQVLAVRPWPWAEGLLALCTPVRRDAIRSASVAAAPALTRFLLDAVGARLAAGTAAQPARRARLAPLLRLVNTWRR